VRALIEGGFLREASAEGAIKYLVSKDIIDAESITEAERLVEAVNPN
jgi:hypothetical protein